MNIKDQLATFKFKEHKVGTKVIVTDKYLNQYEEVLENGVYVRKYLGNKKKEGNLTDKEKEYYIDNKVCKVIDGLFISSADGASDLEILKAAGITHILNVASNVGELFPQHFKYHRKEFPDLPSAPLLEYLDEFIAFIHKARESGGQVLVHCNQGVSRSASIVIAYLMYKDKVSYSQAYMIAAGARPSIKPNYGFEQQLQKYEQRLLEELNKVLP